MRGNADRNASLVIVQRLVARYQKPKQEKPSTPLPRAKKAVKAAGDARSQACECEEGPSLPLHTREGTRIEHGTAKAGNTHDGWVFPAIFPAYYGLA